MANIAESLPLSLLIEQLKEAEEAIGGLGYDHAGNLLKESRDRLNAVNREAAALLEEIASGATPGQLKWRMRQLHRALAGQIRIDG